MRCTSWPIFMNHEDRRNTGGPQPTSIAASNGVRPRRWMANGGGQLYDRHLNDRNKAIELYQAVLAHETNEQRRQEAQRRLGDLGVK